MGEEKEKIKEVNDISKRLEQELRCRMIQFEGIEAIGVKIFWNHQKCPHSGRCYHQEEKEKHQPKPCSYNPKMFECPAYQEYETGKRKPEE
ncbi:MAG: hypothetical protein WCX73_03005 [Candidatus Pacearchaeota archaeon]|jgi:hypothetical protein